MYELETKKSNYINNFPLKQNLLSVVKNNIYIKTVISRWSNLWIWI